MTTTATTGRTDHLGRIAPYSIPSRPRPNVVNWRADPNRCAVLIHDMQHFFLAPFESEFRAGLIERTERILRWARENGAPVAYSMQPGSMTAEQRGLVADFWGPGMRADEAERAVVDPLAPQALDIVVTKWRYSAFTRTPLLERLREQRRDQLIVCGVYAHLGVLATCLDAFGHDIEPFLVSDAIADFGEDRHRLALDWAAGGCAMVLSSEELVTTDTGGVPCPTY